MYVRQIEEDFRLNINSGYKRKFTIAFQFSFTNLQYYFNLLNLLLLRFHLYKINLFVHFLESQF